jgi:hypothetical protein
MTLRRILTNIQNEIMGTRTDISKNADIRSPYDIMVHGLHSGH